MMNLNYRSLLLVFFFITLYSCKSNTLFTKIAPSKSNINFKNYLEEDSEFNVLNYPYFYNGGGVAIGDINNDGLPDILFTGNMVKNRLYLNKGNFEFEDITAGSHVADRQGWCTGATMADVNADGWLDIYICRSADGNPAKRKNLLFINNHDGTFTEQAENYGIADNGYSTHAVFFDYDRDNDLDLLVINHSLKNYMQGKQEIPGILQKKDHNFSTHLYRNDNGHFTEVSDSAGIISNVLSFGLGVAVSDLNNDGWPDIYLSNDFDEGDYCFINQKNGTFKEMSREMFPYTSLFSMGCNATDINNDGFSDIVTLDMLAEGNYMQKMHNGAENFDKFQSLFNHGFIQQYSRNMLHLNRNNGTFLEIGQFAGISNTDWSWAPLIEDFDDDGQKDIFITNGYVKDYTDMDYLKYNVDLITEKDPVKQQKMLKKRLDKLPQIKIANYAFKNNGDLTFSNVNKEWGLNEPGISAGAAYADLDNDGAPDLIISNSNDVASIYRSNLRALYPERRFVNVKLFGDGKNLFGIGAKVIINTSSGMQMQEMIPSRGFQSSVDYTLHFGIPQKDSVKNIIVEWPTGYRSLIEKVTTNKTYVINIKDAVADAPPAIRQAVTVFRTTDTIDFRHKENLYNDFNQQYLLPQWFSRQGPAMAKADINGDGREDFFIGGAKGQPGALFLQSETGSFIRLPSSAIASDSLSEDVTAVFFDVNGDGFPDLFVGSGGYEFGANDTLLQNRLYMNNGKGVFTKNTKTLPKDLINDNTVSIADFNGDGHPDIFIGGFCVPGKYPEPAGVQILLNNGAGIFSKAGDKWTNNFNHAALITSSAVADMNNDGRPDLIICGHWMGIELYLNKGDRFEKDTSMVMNQHGFYNKVIATDIDGDGDIDIIASNQGLNNQYKTSAAEPMEMYYADFDNNGVAEPVISYYIDHKPWPIYSRDDLIQQIPSLNKKFIYYKDYAKASVQDIFAPEKLAAAAHFTASQMQSAVFENAGKGFVMHPLPVEAQWAPVYGMALQDINNDEKKDLIIGGNLNFARIKFGAYEASRGEVLINKGNCEFFTMPPAQSGLQVSGDVRGILTFDKKLIFGINDRSPVMITR